jgi:hypothetical protein
MNIPTPKASRNVENHAQSKRYVTPPIGLHRPAKKDQRKDEVLEFMLRSNFFQVDLSPLGKQEKLSSVRNTCNVQSNTRGRLEDIESRIQSMVQKMPVNIIHPSSESRTFLGGIDVQSGSFNQGSSASLLNCLLGLEIHMSGPVAEGSSCSSWLIVETST